MEEATGNPYQAAADTPTMDNMTPTHTGLVQVTIRTIGLLHPAAADRIENGLFYDLSNELRNPHHDPAMRYKTGLDPDVRDHVRATPGAATWAARIARDAQTLASAAGPTGKLVHVTVACRGGRHRSVAIAEWAAELLNAAGPRAEVEHLHIGLPVVQK